jgi:hypothetical protein
MFGLLLDYCVPIRVYPRKPAAAAFSNWKPIVILTEAQLSRAHKTLVILSEAKDPYPDHAVWVV